MTEFFIYILGYFVTLILLILFGKKYLGLNYDIEKTYANHDDWNSNAEAYVFWCFGWPLVWGFVILLGIWKGLTRITQNLINLTEKREIDSKK